MSRLKEFVRDCMGQERQSIPATKAFDDQPLLVACGRVLRTAREARKDADGRKISRATLASWVGIAPS